MKKTKTWLGIDFGGTNVKLGFVNSSGTVLSQSTFPTASTPTRTAWLDKIEDSVNRLLPENHILAGVGAGVPGFTDFDRGFIYNLTNVPGWRSVPMAELLTKRLGVPAIVDNDANVMALGECTFGAGNRYKHAVFVTLGTGVGGGLLINGEIYRGAFSMGGELGHISIMMDGNRTAEGIGGLETYVGNRQITEKAQAELAKGRESLITRLSDGDPEKITPKIISDAAHQNDSLAIEIFEYVADCLATAFASMTYVLQPEVFIIGGGVAKSGKVLFDPLRQNLKNRLSPFFARRIKVIRAKLGERAGVTGAAALAMKHC
ncbi:MAG: ROK family protein [Lentisphaerae bacterium]|nr:ROK family protein [Lentisphaerota bacterium]